MASPWAALFRRFAARIEPSSGVTSAGKAVACNEGLIACLSTTLPHNTSLDEAVSFTWMRRLRSLRLSDLLGAFGLTRRTRTGIQFSVSPHARTSFVGIGGAVLLGDQAESEPYLCIRFREVVIVHRLE